MKKDEIEEGRISEHSRPLGTATPEMVWERARQLAEINGRGRGRVLESDLEQAWRELTGREEVLSIESDSEAVISTAQWDPAPGTPGFKVPTKPAQDEQSESERLTEEGMDEAEHDRMLEATKEARREDET